ncbi:DNA/RNA non-specific endonuclease [Aquimarina brevivitae]|uniref:Fibronectin type III domain protein n=1 Tax=Aquimarina brevivitae TaxID=323412 RepID=A0A4Q7PET9_9FLAO|nr:DNA/RNA non-specific endonuclease [Aquimarina brevivitae]RZS98983.1 fibronectin type III domain protein [Aquimarina brevivitae]
MKRILLLLLLCIQTVSAQNFPIRVTAQALPPYPTAISGYANANVINSPLRVQLVLSDITASSREVRLRIAIEGNGISATSAAVVVGAPTLILDGGVPLNLTLADLAPYYEFQNLQGISPVQYNSALPDGTYRFCFEVFDAFNGNRLSTQQCATIFLVNNQPPFLNKPDNQSSITEQNPTNIIFQWTPRQVNVPNVNYEFSLVEVWDKYIDPQAIFLASPPLYQETTINTSLVYGPLQPLLMPGKRYAWRIRAFANNNGEEVSVFNNNGNSEIFWFDYLGNCNQPSGITVKDVTRTQATISWTSQPDHLDYTVHYREQGSERWYQKTTPRDYITIDEFKENTVYEYKVVGHCTKESYSESPVDSFRTLTEELEEYTACGIQPDPVDLSNQELLAEVFVNDVFTAGDFPIYIKELSSPLGGGAVGGGGITGEGYISTPWLATVRIPVKFENIKVNTDMKLVDGFVVTTYDPNWGSIVDADEIIEVVVGDDGDIDVINVDNDIVDIEVNDDGTITIITADGQEIIQPGGEDVIYVDNTGETWQVGEDGTVTQGQQAEGGPANSGNTNGVGSGGVNEITATGVRVDFIKSGYYAVDTYPQNAGGSIANNYESIPVTGGGTYYPIYKAVSNLPEHPSDLLTAQATFNDSDITKEDIIFKTKEGVNVPANWNGNTATLSIRKAFEFGKEEIIAAVKPKDSTSKFDVAGNAYLWHLASQEVTDINVTLVPVNGASVPNDVANRINEIYNPAGIKFNVETGPRLNIPENVWDIAELNQKLDIGDSKTLQHYTTEEKAIIDYYKTNATVDSQMYYLFVTDMPVTKDGVSGFMPLKRQYGFVFDQSDVGRTAAHELGHGVFGLEHPFTEYNTTSGATDLLMDYGNGVTFNHMEWEKMHAPGIQIYWFQGDEDGENIGFNISQLNGLENEAGETFTFISPSGELIVIPKANLKHVVFKDGLRSDFSEFDVVQGTLLGFGIEEEKDFVVNYNYNFDEDKYRKESEEGEYTMPSNINNYLSSAIMMYSCSDGFYLSKFSVENIKPYDQIIDPIKDVIKFPIKMKSNNTQHYAETQRNILDSKFFNMNPLPSSNKYDIAVDPDFFTVLESEMIQRFGGCNNYAHFSILRLISLAAFQNELFEEFEIKLTTHSLGSKYEDIYIRLQEMEDSSDALLFFKLYADSFRLYLDEYRQYQSDLLNNLSVNTPKTDLDAILVGFNVTDFNTLEYEKRLTILRAYARNIKVTATNPREDWILDLADDAIAQRETAIRLLITSMPDDDKKNFLSDLIKAYPENPDSPNLLFSLLYIFDGQNYIDISTAITIWLIENKELLETVPLARTIDDKQLLFSPGLFNNYGNVEWLREDGKIVLGNFPIWYTTNGNTVSDETIEFVYDPYEVVNIFIHDDYNFQNQMSFTEGTSVQLPAITLFMLFNKVSNESAEQGAMFALDVALFAIGVGEIKTALTVLNNTERIVRTSIAISDMVLGVADASINRVWFNEINNSGPEGQQFLKDWNSLMMYYGFARLSYELTDLAVKLYGNLKTNKGVLGLNDEQVEAFQSQIKAKSGLDPNSPLVDEYLRGASFSDDILPLGDDLSRVSSWIEKSDNYIDVVIHSNDSNTFSILIDGTEYELTTQKLATHLKGMDSNKTIRLLSCNNTESAIEISQIIERDIIGSSGEMKIYDNGLIETQQWYKVDPNGNIDDLFDISSSLSRTDNYVVLRARKYGDGVIDLLTRTLGSKFDDFMESLNKIPSTWTIENRGGILKLVDGSGKEWVEITAAKVKAIAGDAGNGWNKLLNIDPPLMKNYAYDVDNGKYIYNTDNLGRVETASIKDLDINPRARKEDYQQHTKKVKDGKPDDDGGHIFRNQWGGPSEQINYFSQNAYQNRTGEWYQMEKSITELKQANPNSKIDVDMQFIFEGNSKRPKEIRVIVTKDGVPALDGPFLIENP